MRISMVYESTGSWAWVTEKEPWALPHTLLPFLAYLYLRDPFMVMTAVYVWESVELALLHLFDEYKIFLGEAPVESAEDSLFGDPLNGALGVMAAMAIVRRYGWPRARLDLLVHGLQFLSLAVHTVWLRAYIGDIPVGYIITLVALPLQILTYWTYWNEWAHGGRLSAFCFLFILAFVQRWGDLPYMVAGWISLGALTAVMLVAKPGVLIYQALLP